MTDNKTIQVVSADPSNSPASEKKASVFDWGDFEPDAWLEDDIRREEKSLAEVLEETFTPERREEAFGTGVKPSDVYETAHGIMRSEFYFPLKHEEWPPFRDWVEKAWRERHPEAPSDIDFGSWMPNEWYGTPEFIRDWNGRMTLDSVLSSINWDAFFENHFGTVADLREAMWRRIDDACYSLTPEEWRTACDRLEKELVTRLNRHEAAGWRDEEFREELRALGYAVSREDVVDGFFEEVCPQKDLSRLIAIEGPVNAAKMLLEDDWFGENRFGRAADFTLEEIVMSWYRTGRLMPQKAAKRCDTASLTALMRFIDEKCDELEDALHECGAGTGIWESRMRGAETPLGRLRIGKKALALLLAQARWLSDLRDAVSDLDVRSEAFDQLLKRADSLTLDVEEVAGDFGVE